MSAIVSIATPTLSGSISLKGGRIDDLTLIGYRESVDPESANIILLSPGDTERPYFADFGWSASAQIPPMAALERSFHQA